MLASVEICISLNDQNWCLWGEVKLLVITSRTKISLDQIFVGDKQITLDALGALL